MSSRKVVIELRSNRLDVVVYERTKRVASRRAPLDLPTDIVGWNKAVRQCDSTVRAAVEELQVKPGTPVTVLYRSPSQAVDLCSLPIRSAAAAIEAARLQSLEAFSSTDSPPVCEAMFVGRDRHGSRGKNAPHTHVVVVSDREDVIDAIIPMVENAGLVFHAALPIDAAIMTLLAGRALAGQDTGVTLLYLGEHSSCFFLAAGGAMHFGRRIGLGYDALIAGLTRPIRSTHDAEPLTLTSAQAQAMLFEVGIPGFDQIVSNQPPLVGRQIVPLMQPILQRLVVEMRQSLRFGVPADIGAPPYILLQGPGSRIPGLCTLLQSELQVPTTVDERSAQFDPAMPASRGSELVDSMREHDAIAQLNLQPAALVRSRTAVRLKRALWTGAAAAVALLAMDFASYESLLSDARDKASHTTGRSSIERNLQMQRSLAAGIAAIHQVENTLQVELAARPNHRALLAELTHLTPQNVRLASIGFSIGAEGRTVGTLSGQAFHEDREGGDWSAGGGGGLAVFIDNLRRSPLFSEVVLANVQAFSQPNSSGERFDARFVAIDVPVLARGEMFVSHHMEATHP